nr:MlaD family protein [Massilia oculi]
MSEPDGARPPQGPSSPDVDRPSRWLPSLIWLIPLLAAIIGAWQVVQWVTNKGPTVYVYFATGEGLEANTTRVKYKDVDIGRVVSVTLAEDGNRVVAKIEMAKEAGRFTAKDSRFWVVRPQIGASGVSGLGTLLSGPYIGAAPGTSEDSSNAFTGLETAPPIPIGLKGREYLLHADTLGSVAPGSPVYFRRVRVGQVAKVELDKAGQGIDMSVFVEQPYIGFVGADTRWYHASGVDLRLDASGLKLNTQSLAALATGGIAFESTDGKKPAAPARRAAATAWPKTAPLPCARRTARPPARCCTSTRRCAAWRRARRSTSAAWRWARCAAWASNGTASAAASICR